MQTSKITAPSKTILVVFIRFSSPLHCFHLINEPTESSAVTKKERKPPGMVFSLLDAIQHTIKSTIAPARTTKVKVPQPVSWLSFLLLPYLPALFCGGFCGFIPITVAGLLRILTEFPCTEACPYRFVERGHYTSLPEISKPMSPEETESSDLCGARGYKKRLCPVFVERLFLFHRCFHRTDV